MNARPKTITGRTRQAKAARDKRYADKVRAYVMDVRDQCCRAWFDLGPCEGVFEWAHLGDQQRFKTRGQPPEERHTSRGTCKLCTKHHGAYDRGEIEYQFRSAKGKGADGPMTWGLSGESAFQRVR